MPAFEFTALNAKGLEQRGVLEGETARAVRQMLRERHLTPISVTETKQAARARGQFNFKFRPSVSSKDLSLFTRQLSTLCRSGSPLEEALSTVAKQTAKNHVKSVILDVRSKVMEGHSLAAALMEHPRIFPDLYRATVAAGEQSGHLDLVLERLADYTEARQEMNQKVGMALTYPIILSVVAIIIVAVLLTYVVPQVVQVFDNIGRELPFLTRALIAVSDFTKHYGLFLIILVGAAAYGLTRLLRQPAFRFGYDRGLLRLPIIGMLTQGLNTARFARTLSILAASGVPILEALSIAAQVVRNVPMRKAVETATLRVREGSSISKALENSGLFPPMTVHLIASGESSGKLEEMLERTAHYQERETTATITTIVGLFEHFMILIMGAVVLLIVLAILLPIFDLNQLVQ
ncbi:MAG: type II secretion system inner membrane protein GspF [Gammaproteobacteria bacterium]|nr:type II secretion system inner membrane protein GspF [Gammaproteobacteria bacterium]